jgi:hypothetical protein
MLFITLMFAALQTITAASPAMSNITARANDVSVSVIQTTPAGIIGVVQDGTGAVVGSVEFTSGTQVGITTTLPFGLVNMVILDPDSANPFIQFTYNDQTFDSNTSSGQCFTTGFEFGSNCITCSFSSTA